MNSISFGKITPKARETAQLQILGMRAVAGGYENKQAHEKILAEEKALIRAENDSEYLFDVNPKYVIDKKRSKKGQLYFVDDHPFLMYKTKENKDKYAYLGRFNLLQDGCRLANKINYIIELNNWRGKHMKAADHCIASYIQNADSSQDFHNVMNEARKILNIKG